MILFVGAVHRNHNQIQKFFERFDRIEDEETRISKGTGLGLFLVNEIVKIHGGRIKCRENLPNGTIFDIKFKTNYA